MKRERRIAWDGIAYTWEEFFEEYGREASDFWADAPDAAERGAPLAAGNSGAATERTEAPQVAVATGNNGAATELTEEPIPASGSDDYLPLHGLFDPLCPYDNERLAIEEADALDVDFGQEWYRG